MNLHLRSPGNRGFGHTDRTVGCLIALWAQSLLQFASLMECVGGQHKKLDPMKVPEGGEQCKGLAVPVLLCWRAPSCPCQKPSKNCSLSISWELIRKTQRFAAGAGRDLDELLFMEVMNKVAARSKSRARLRKRTRMDVRE